MADVLGLDVNQADDLSRNMRSKADEFENAATQLTSNLANVQWTGNYANRFREDWNGPARQNLTHIVEMLREASQALAQHAEAQRQVSGN
jgi:uncharacterized protein YukE